MATQHQNSIRKEIISKFRPSGNLIESRVKFDEPPKGTNMARELIRAFKVHSDRVLLVDAASRRQWTGGQLLDTCGRIATGLISQVQMRPDDIVMTICEHTGEEILAALGIVLAGGALFGTSPQDGYSELKVTCELVKPNVIIASSRQNHVAMALRQSIPGLAQAKIVWLDNPMKHFDSGIVVIDSNNNNEIDANNNNINCSQSSPDEVILLDDLLAGQFDEQLVESIACEQIDSSKHMLSYMLTSGSTGRPKVVPSTHEELIYGLYSMISSTKYPLVVASSSSNGDHLLPLGPNSVLAGDLPLDHGAGLNTMFLALCLGAKYIVMPSYEVDTFWQAVNDYKITDSIASTSFGYKLFHRLKQLIDANNHNNNSSTNNQPRWDLSSLKYITCCGAKLSFIELVREVQSVYEQLHVSQAYGCTEIGWISILPASESFEDEYLKSTGYLMPGLLAKVVDVDQPGRNGGGATKTGPLGPMERGELLVWAQSKFKGYRCHPSDDGAQLYANCHDAEQLFYRTGDQAHYDAQGRLYIHGRFKDTLYLMEDWKILPAELEAVVDLHPLVEQTAIIGVPDPELPGCHKPRAFCKLISKAQLAQLSDDDDEEEQNDELRARYLANDLEFIKQHIYRFMADRTARPKHLTGGIRIVDEFPRNGLLNKIDRKALAIMD